MPEMEETISSMPEMEETEGGRPRKRQRLSIESEPGGSADGEQPSGSTGVRYEVELAERLRKVMLCTVCLEMPQPEDSNQCILGHIVCGDCVARLLAEAALVCHVATCPQCRTPISRETLTKNLAVGQTIYELPKSCPDCDMQMECKSLAKHLKMECVKRKVHCKYRALGCCWLGCQEQSSEHVVNCKSLELSADEILAQLAINDQLERDATQQLVLCHRQLSAQRISYEDIDIRWPPITSFNTTEIRFRTSTIYVFEETWRVIVKVLHGSETNRRLCYSLRLLSSPRQALLIKYFITLPANHVEPKQLLDVEPRLYEKYFSQAGHVAEFKPLPMSSQMATYRLLSMQLMQLRIWMMLH